MHPVDTSGYVQSPQDRALGIELNWGYIDANGVEGQGLTPGNESMMRTKLRMSLSSSTSRPFGAKATTPSHS